MTRSIAHAGGPWRTCRLAQLAGNVRDDVAEHRLGVVALAAAHVHQHGAAPLRRHDRGRLRIVAEAADVVDDGRAPAATGRR